MHRRKMLCRQGAARPQWKDQQSENSICPGLPLPGVSIYWICFNCYLESPHYCHPIIRALLYANENAGREVRTTATVLIAVSALAANTAPCHGESNAISVAENTKMLASCAVCHGDAGAGSEARAAPRLAGLDAAYLERQLDLFASGKRGTMRGDHIGSQMYVIAQSLTPEDRKAAATHYASSDAPPAPPTLPRDEASDRGRQGYQACAACHGEDGMGNRDIGAPRVAGQGDWYILRSLKAFHSGARGYDEADAAGKQMSIALEAVDPSEFEAIASYAAALGPE